MEARKYPSKEYLDKIFRYAAETGILYNRIRRSQRSKKDAPAGYLNKTLGYLCVGINYKEYGIHRIIWIMLNGSIAGNLQIDHIDHNRANNKLENLRVVTQVENLKNQKIYKNNKSGHVGICRHKLYGKWEVKISVEGKRISLGYFENIEDAIKARKAAEVKYNYHKNHGN